MIKYELRMYVILHSCKFVQENQNKDYNLVKNQVRKYLDIYLL